MVKSSQKSGMSIWVQNLRVPSTLQSCHNSLVRLDTLWYICLLIALSAPLCCDRIAQYSCLRFWRPKPNVLEEHPLPYSCSKYTCLCKAIPFSRLLNFNYFKVTSYRFTLLCEGPHSLAVETGISF